MKAKIKRDRYSKIPNAGILYVLISKVKMMRIAKSIDTLNEGWKPDWSSSFSTTWYAPKTVK